MKQTERLVRLDEHEESFIESQVASGDYPDADAVIKAALERLEEEQEELRALIMEGVRDIEEGRYKDYESADELIRDIRQRAASIS